MKLLKLVLLMNSRNDNSLENIKNISNELHIENFIHQDLLKEKLKEIENMKNIGGIKMSKSVQELLNEYPQLMNDLKIKLLANKKKVKKKQLKMLFLKKEKE